MLFRTNSSCVSKCYPRVHRLAFKVTHTDTDTIIIACYCMYLTFNVVQVAEVLVVSMHDAGCKTTQIKVKITVMESDTANLQWYFIRCKFVRVSFSCCSSIS